MLGRQSYLADICTTNELGRAIAAFGTGGVLAGSVGLTAVAALGAAMAPPWPVLIALALLSGLGAGAVDAAMNLFASARFAPSSRNTSLGMALGPGRGAMFAICVRYRSSWSCPLSATAVRLIRPDSPWAIWS